jgi:hypothetical protein
LRGQDSVGYVLAGAMYWVEDSLGSTEDPSVLLGGVDRVMELDVMRA